ncbi:MAG: phosphodiester glycosidase family protein [Bacteroidota bacterium]
MNHFWIGNRIGFLFLICLLSCSSVKEVKFEKEEGIWKMTSLGEGITYKSMFNKPYKDSRQTIHVVEVDFQTCDCGLQLGHANGELTKTSRWAKKHKAVAAINGNFFDPENGGAVCYVKSLGELVNPTKPDPEEMLFLPMLDEGAIGLENGLPRQLEKPDGGWEVLDTPSTILSSGPMLLKNGQILPQEDINFMNKRHARTAVGLSPGKMWMVVVDGYRPQASGMSMHELSDLLKELGSENAINLDGGGSSTLWVSTQNQKGVVNYPTDNDKFDHKGERKVANAVLVVPK